jgi:hypothetical protein
VFPFMRPFLGYTAFSNKPKWHEPKVLKRPKTSHPCLRVSSLRDVKIGSI